MNRVCSIFSQILQFVPRLEFESAVQKAKHRQHGFASWDQFGAMMFCQLGHAQSLREITGGLACCEGKLKHLGMDGAPAHSTLAYANANRPWQLYQDVFQTLLGRCQHEAQNHKRKFRFKHKLLSIDGTMIELSLSMFDWAAYKRTKGALKLHMVLDHDGYLPCYAVMTDGKESEMKVAKSIDVPTRHDAGIRPRLSRPRLVVIVDPKQGEFRDAPEGQRGLRRGLPARSVQRRRYHPGRGHCPDKPTGDRSEGPTAAHRGMVEERKETMVFVTNNLKFAARTIAAIYKERWQIELFFKALKQSLKIKTFVGTSENAVQIQIWTALIAMLLLKYLQLRSTFAWSFSHLVALIRHQLFVYRDLMSWLNNPYQAPPALEGIHDQQFPLDFAQQAAS